jgi:hypothetical protein
MKSLNPAKEFSTSNLCSVAMFFMTTSVHSCNIFLWSSFGFDTRLPSLMNFFHLFIDSLEITWCRSKRCWYDIVVGWILVSTANPDELFGQVILRVIFDELFFLFFLKVLVDHMYLSCLFYVYCAYGLCYWSRFSPFSISWYLSFNGLTGCFFGRASSMC